LIDLKKTDHVIWLQTAFLGDLVLTTAAMQLLKESFPKVKQFAVSTSLGKKVFSYSEAIESTFVLEKKRGKGLSSFFDIKRALQSAGCKQDKTLILQPHRSFRSSFLAKFLRYPTVSYHQSNLAWLAELKVERVAVLHEAARIGLLLEPMGVAREKIIAAMPRLRSLPLDQNVSWHRDLLSKKGPVIAVAPGSVWGTKKWPLSYFTELIKRLLVEQSNPKPFRLLLLGSVHEKLLTDQIVAQLPKNDVVLNLAGETSLDDLNRIYPHLDLLISNDSSPIHYGSAFDVPTVALFGATIPEMGFGPLASGSKTLGVEGLPCRPCSDHGPQHCPLSHFKCMRDLTVDSVFAEVSAQLQKWS